MNNSKNYANANFELKLQILFAFIIQNYDFINHITNYKESVYYKLFLSSIFIIKENYLFGIGFD